MDERVEITDVPQPFQPHPDAPIIAYTDSYPKASDAETVRRPRRNATLIWAGLSFVCLLAVVAWWALTTYNIIPMMYWFEGGGPGLHPNIIGVANIVLVYLSVIFSCISCLMALGSDDLMPSPRRRNYAVGCLSLLISFGAALFLTFILAVIGGASSLLYK